MKIEPGKRKDLRRAALLCLCAALLLLPVSALAVYPAVEGISTPDTDTLLSPGDVISYEFHFLEGMPAVGSLYAIRVALSDGMKLVEGSARMISVTDPYAVSPVPLSTPEPSPGPSATPAAKPVKDVIYGNDGLVLLASEVSIGDRLIFKAITGEISEAICTVYYGEEEYTLAHTVDLPLAATSAADGTSAAPEAPAAEETAETPVVRPSADPVKKASGYIVPAIAAVLIGAGLTVFFFLKKHRKAADAVFADTALADGKDAAAEKTADALPADAVSAPRPEEKDRA